MHTHERQRQGAFGLGLSLLILSSAGCGHFKYDPYGTGTGEMPVPRQPVQAPEVVTATVTLTGPTLIGFFPPVNEAELDNDATLSAAFEEFTATLEGARTCLLGHGIVVRAAFARALIADSNGQQTPLPLGEHTPQIGFYLWRGDRAPQRVDAPEGTGSWRRVLNQELSAYFGIPPCAALEVKP